jgi:hypothetical protein
MRTMTGSVKLENNAGREPKGACRLDELNSYKQ